MCGVKAFKYYPLKMFYHIYELIAMRVCDRVNLSRLIGICSSYRINESRCSPGSHILVLLPIVGYWLCNALHLSIGSSMWQLQLIFHQKVQVGLKLDWEKNFIHRKIHERGNPLKITIKGCFYLYLDNVLNWKLKTGLVYICLRINTGYL